MVLKLSILTLGLASGVVCGLPPLLPSALWPPPPLLQEPVVLPFFLLQVLLFLHDKVLWPLHCNIIRTESSGSFSCPTLTDRRILNSDLRKSALASRILRALDRELGDATVWVLSP